MSRKRKGYNRRRKLWGRNNHHLTPRSRGGSSKPSNLCLLRIDSHAAWHRLFQNRTLREVIQLLERLEARKMKEERGYDRKRHHVMQEFDEFQPDRSVIFEDDEWW